MIAIVRSPCARRSGWQCRCSQHTQRGLTVGRRAVFSMELSHKPGTGRSSYQLRSPWESGGSWGSAVSAFAGNTQSRQNAAVQERAALQRVHRYGVITLLQWSSHRESKFKLFNLEEERMLRPFCQEDEFSHPQITFVQVRWWAALSMHGMVLGRWQAKNQCSHVNTILEDLMTLCF